MTNSHSNNVFSIECEDIILREYTIDDLDELHALTWQPHFYEFLPDWNVSKEQRADWIRNYEIPDNKRFLKADSNFNSILNISGKKQEHFIPIWG